MSDMPNRVRLDPDYDGDANQVIGWGDYPDLLDPEVLPWPVYIHEDIARADTTAAVTAALEGAAAVVATMVRTSRLHLYTVANLTIMDASPGLVAAASIRAMIPADGPAAFDAMIAAAVEQGFRARIIPLDWKEVRSLGVGQREFSASTILGEYSVSAGGWANGKTAVSMPTRSETLWLDGGIEDGQRAARDDYEAHILSAIREGAPE